MKEKGSYLNKKIYVYNSNITNNESDVENFLKKYNYISLLRKTSDLAKELFDSDEEYIQFQEVPVYNSLLIFLAEKIAKSINRNSQIEVSNSEFGLLLKMTHNLVNNQSKNSEKDFETLLLKIAYSQLNASSVLNLFGRSYYLFYKIWPLVDKAKHIKILDEIENIIGIPYQLALIFTLMHIGNKNSYFFAYTKKELAVLESLTQITINNDTHQKFVNWISIDFDKVQNWKEKIEVFSAYPVLNLEFKPNENDKNAYLIISYINLIKKTTSSLYFHLINHFNLGKGNNPFKVAYGYVLEHYVGDILRYYYNTWDISGEIEYDKKKHSVDFLVKENDKLLLIEVKQSSIFLESRISADKKTIKNDLKKTLIKAAEQLRRSEQAIVSNNHKEFTKYSDVKFIQKIIVTGDEFQYSNLIAKRIINEEINDKNFNFTIMSIDEFEELLELTKVSKSLFEVLEYKTVQSKYDLMDTHDYLYELFEDKRENYKSEYMSNKFQEFYKFANIK